MSTVAFAPPATLTREPPAAEPWTMSVARTSARLPPDRSTSTVAAVSPSNSATEPPLTASERSLAVPLAVRTEPPLSSTSNASDDSPSMVPREPPLRTIRSNSGVATTTSIFSELVNALELWIRSVPSVTFVFDQRQDVPLRMHLERRGLADADPNVDARTQFDAREWVRLARLTRDRPFTSRPGTAAGSRRGGKGEERGHHDGSRLCSTDDVHLGSLTGAAMPEFIDPRSRHLHRRCIGMPRSQGFRRASFGAFDQQPHEREQEGEHPETRDVGLERRRHRPR